MRGVIPGGRWPVDLLPALAVGLGIGVGSWQADGNQDVPRRPLDLPGWAVIAVAVACLPLWRRRPVAGLLVAAAAGSGYFALRYPYGPLVLAVAMLGFGAGRYHGRPWPALVA